MKKEVFFARFAIVAIVVQNQKFQFVLKEHIQYSEIIFVLIVLMDFIVLLKVVITVPCVQKIIVVLLNQTYLNLVKQMNILQSEVSNALIVMLQIIVTK